MTFQPRHVSLAVVLHLMLFGLLIGGVQCSHKIPPARVIEAVLYDPSRQQAAQQKKHEEQKRLDEERRRREQLEQQKRQKAEAEERTRVETERKRKEAEVQERQKKVAEQERQKKAELAQQKKAEQERQKKAEQERVKKEQQEQREKAEQERREAEMKTQMQREIEQENLRRQMDQEAQALRQGEIAAKTSEWAALVERHIQKNWIRPGGANEEFGCAVQVVLLPDGTVTSAKITRSCGSPALNKSVEDAVFRASPIPRPDDPAAFDRDLTINFTPQ